MLPVAPSALPEGGSSACTSLIWLVTRQQTPLLRAGRPHERAAAQQKQAQFTPCACAQRPQRLPGAAAAPPRTARRLPAPRLSAAAAQSAAACRRRRPPLPAWTPAVGPLPAARRPPCPPSAAVLAAAAVAAAAGGRPASAAAHTRGGGPSTGPARILACSSKRNGRESSLDKRIDGQQRLRQTLAGEHTTEAPPVPPSPPTHYPFTRLRAWLLPG